MGQTSSVSCGVDDSAPLKLSVIVPALNESTSIASALQSVLSAAVPPLEVITVDGGSNDGTADVARRHGSKVVVSERGRGKQLNAGWRAAKGDWCLFLHADSQLPPRYDEQIAAALQRRRWDGKGQGRRHWATPAAHTPGVQQPPDAQREPRAGQTGHLTPLPVGMQEAAEVNAPSTARAGPGRWASRLDRSAEASGSGRSCEPTWGAFASFDTDLRNPLWRAVLTRGVELRTRLLHRPYGDQAIFVRRDALEACGGFRDWPLLEDLDLVTRLGRKSAPVIVDARVFTSGRRWETVGFVRNTLINQAILVAFAAGVPPQTLAEWYRSARRAAAGAGSAPGPSSDRPSHAAAAQPARSSAS
ncbi:hypothetical protein HYH03_005292 [Edaphochlamys debaryana]|uniref:Glycosyltransferase 2-like domain-containing protein n=1 Tax=Edaphochlamys debaryana TaxID=47281 RepID=A0A836C179_9CHLO|nr:hypothetical protein HYH03_005292 [Edaphochlamys debaryana]|eukprot:KAG2496465.1 hypothetical protein HYH03_005292 [Edaphochlamys debaryana]